MASSSVSQDDIENNYERLERRSRIRTARARQINPQACRVESSVVDRLPPIGIEIEDSIEQLTLDTNNAVNLSPYSAEGGGGGGGGGGDTSPKPMARAREQKISTEKRPSKLHHANKGKQQRDRRKLREKRRSTGVVHLASTESTGGSTSGEDEESGGEIIGLETKRNTQQNETIAEAGQPSPPLEQPERKNSGHKHHSPLYARPRLRGGGDKSPRSEDQEADDEQGDKTDNDHDSLNMSQSSSAASMITVGVGASPAGLLVETTSSSTPVMVNSSNSTPVFRPATPTQGDAAYSPERCVEENKELLQLVQEKDRRIQYLELRIQQLTQETRAIVEEHSKLKEENSALMKAISSIHKQ